MGINPPNLPQDAFNLARLEALGILAAPVISAAVTDYITTGKVELPGIPPAIAEAILNVIGTAESTVGEPIFDALLGASLGISDLGAAGSQEEAAVRTIKRALGFGIGLPIAAGAAELPLKALLGEHLGTGIFEALRGISDEAGISFFLGFTLSNIFQTAVGQPITEAIARRTHPARFDFRIVKALLKAHKLDDGAAADQLAGLGFREGDANLLMGLADAVPGIAELQQAFLYGIRDEAYVRDKLAQAGFDADGVDLLIQVYLSRAVTTGGSELRTVAQTGYLDDHLSEAQYRALLKQANVPPASIELEVEAANLVKGWGRLQLSVDQIKSAYQAGRMDGHAALGRLVANGYTEDDAQTIIESWAKAAKAGKIGLSEARVLSYELGGLLSRDQAYARLRDLNYAADDAAFMADNPGSFGGVYRYPLTPAAIIAAVRSGDLDDAAARQLLAGQNIDPAAIDLQIKVAEHALRRSQKAQAAPRLLSEAQVLDALHQGLAAPSWALSELSLLGYSDADAQLLVALEQTKAAGAVPEGWVTLS